MELIVDIEKSFGSFDLKVNFKAQQNILGLLGASGSGKSMTLRCIAGLETPDGGRIVLNDRILFDSQRGINIPSRQRRVGFLFQNYALFPHMTVEENIGFALSKLSKQEKAAVVAEKIAMMQLTGLEGRYPQQLSGGQQQRVALARALAVDPEVLLLDEPFSALDNHLRSQMERQLMDTLTEYNGVALFVSHNMDEVYHVCEDIIILDQGAIAANGSKQQIFSAPPSLAAAQLMGCRNISRVQHDENGNLKSLDWGIIIKTEEEKQEKASYIGIRSYDIQVNNGFDFNALQCTIASYIENPRGVIAYLRPLGSPPEAKLIEWELSKEQWIVICEAGQEIIDIFLPPKYIFTI